MRTQAPPPSDMRTSQTRLLSSAGAPPSAPSPMSNNGGGDKRWCNNSYRISPLPASNGTSGRFCHPEGLWYSLTAKDLEEAIMAEIKPTNETHSMEIPVTEVPSQSIEKRVAPDRHQDVYAWVLDQAQRLRHYQPESVDWFGLAEELEIIVALERAKVVSLLRVILVHLLKWRYSKIRRSEHSWRKSLLAARVNVINILEGSAIFRNELSVFLRKGYESAKSLAGTEMRLDKHEWQDLFPRNCPWSESEVLDEDFILDIAPNADGR